MHRVTVNGEPVKRARHHDEHVPDDVIRRYLLSEHKHMSDKEELGCKAHHDERGNPSHQMSPMPQPSPSLTFAPRMKNRTPATYAMPPPAFRVHSISSVFSPTRYSSLIILQHACTSSKDRHPYSLPHSTTLFSQHLLKSFPGRF